MTLLDDLQSLDLSAIVEARGSISGSISSPELQAILEGGAAKTALAGLGSSLEQVRGLGDAEALLRPVLDAVHELLPGFSLENLPLANYLDVVREGAETMVSLFGGLDGEPVLARLLGNALSQLGDRAGDLSDGVMRTVGVDLVRFKSLVDTVEGGAPTDPAAFAELALGALAPFPVASLRKIRVSVDAVTGSLGAIRLPTERTVGLVAAFDAVTAAAVAVDANALARALRDLEHVRASTLSTLESELLRLRSRIDALPIEATLGVVAGVTASLERAGDGVLEYLERWRREIATARELVEDVDVAALLAAAPAFLDALEATVRSLITEEIDRQVEKLKEFLRSLLAHLPLRDLREEFSRFIHDAAKAVEDADLDAPAQAVRGAIQSLTSAIASPDLGGSVRDAVEDAEKAISDALESIEGALDAIHDAIEEIAGEAQEVLGRAADALAGFKAAIDEVTAAIDGAGIEQAGQQVLDRIIELREAAQELLTAAPLPESMRPLVEQLVDALEALDIEAVVKEPITKAAEVFEIPDSVGDTITAGLQAAKDALDNLIPAQLVQAIETEIDAALDQLTAFDPTVLLGDVTSVIRDAAAEIEKLDPRALVEDLAAPFDDVLAAVDAAHPRRLLAPAIKAYRSLFDAIPTPPVTEGLKAGVAAMSSAGEAVGRAAMTPVLQAAPEGTQVADQPVLTGPIELPTGDLPKPGDLVRLFGYLPRKLRETLADVEAGPAGAVLAEIDRFVGGLAGDLRGFDAAIWELDRQLEAGLDELLAPVGQAQLRAQLAIQASFSARVGGGGVTVDVDAAIGAVAAAGSGGLRADLAQVTAETRGLARTTAELASGAGVLPRIATALERSRLASVTGGLDQFLAALDPEPIAAELDALVEAALAKAPAILGAAAELRTLADRVQALVRELNPAAQAQRYLAVLDVVREELELLDPGRLADELAEVHAAARATIAAFDPRLLADELGKAVKAVADQLRSLDPAALLGDLSFLDGIRARIDAIDPAAALAEVGEPLRELGERIAELDPAALLETVNELGPRLAEAAAGVAEAIRRELLTLLEALRFARAEASVEVEASVST